MLHGVHTELAQPQRTRLAALPLYMAQTFGRHAVCTAKPPATRQPSHLGLAWPQLGPQVLQIDFLRLTGQVDIHNLRPSLLRHLRAQGGRASRSAVTACQQPVLCCPLALGCQASAPAERDTTCCQGASELWCSATDMRICMCERDVGRRCSRAATPLRGWPDCKGRSPVRALCCSNARLEANLPPTPCQHTPHRRGRGCAGPSRVRQY